MTTIKRNAGGDIALDLAFYGPPAAEGALGDPFDLTGWNVRMVSMSTQIQGKEVITVADQTNGVVNVLIEGTSALREGTQTFRLQIVRASGPTTGPEDEGFSVGFPVTRIVIGDYNTEDFDGEPPFQQLSGKNGVQVTIAPREPEIIFGAAPAPGDQLTTSGGEPFVTSDGEPFIVAAA